ncbi:hypothetical protein ABNX05_09005 [Lysinibacillus sp. M3]|uniref:Uncharacterized protein n=1 Tax=Lysinibacillus zambalensis TaxID=3160866 RepID=A0ABV1MU24_9BACI
MMINSKAVLIPMLVLFITLLCQIIIQWGENTTVFWFYLFGVIFLAIVLLYSLFATKREKEL